MSQVLKPSTVLDTKQTNKITLCFPGSSHLQFPVWQEQSSSDSNVYPLLVLDSPRLISQRASSQRSSHCATFCLLILCLFIHQKKQVSAKLLGAHCVLQGRGVFPLFLNKRSPGQELLVFFSGFFFFLIVPFTIPTHDQSNNDILPNG